MARIWFSGYHTGSTVSQKSFSTIGQLVASEGLDMEGATIMLGRGDHTAHKITDYETILMDGDVITIQKTSVKSGGLCTAREVSSESPQPKEDIPRLMKDKMNGEIVLVSQNITTWTAGVFVGTIVLSTGSRQLGFQGAFNKTAFSPWYGKVEIEYKR